MLYLSDQDIQQVLTMRDAIELVERAHVACAQGRAVDTPRTRTLSASRSLNILQAAAPEIGVTGYKAYYATPSGTQSHVYLYDYDSGKLLAQMDCNFHLNTTRTGAASGLATRHLARSTAHVIGQIGAGNHGASQLAAVCAVRPIKRAQVYARTREKLVAFCEQMSARLKIEIVAAESAEAAVRGADVVNLITKSAIPVLLGEWLAPGQHINAAGSNALMRRELDAEAARRCALIAVDSRGTARNECGDLLPLVEAGLLHWEALPEIGEIAAGMRPGRTSDEQITLYESLGLGIQDIYVAAKVLERARELKLGREI